MSSWGGARRGLGTALRRGLGLSVLVGACLVWGCSSEVDGVELPPPESAGTAPRASDEVLGGVRSAVPATDENAAADESPIGDVAVEDPAAVPLSPLPRSLQELVAAHEAGRGSPRWAGSRWAPLEGVQQLGSGEVAGVRMGASPQDSAGGLWVKRPSSFVDRNSEVAGEILDLCVLEEAIRAGNRGDRSNASISDANFLRIDLDCGDAWWLDPEMRRTDRYLYFDPRGDYRRFDTRAEAEAYKQLFESTWAELTRYSPPLGALHLGFGEPDSWDSWPWYFGSGYSGDERIDEVIVVPGLLSVRGGALRGLARNFSRDRFAYGVVVAVGDRQWRWPLSVQPGEAVPFEFEGWDEAEAPRRLEFDVSAEMSPDVDLSRAFKIWSTWQRGYLTEDQFEGSLPAEFYASLPAGTESVSYLSVDPEVRRGWGHDPVAPGSHPSSLDAAGSMSSFELRSFVAWFDGAGRVLDVQEIVPIGSRTEKRPNRNVTLNGSGTISDEAVFDNRCMLLRLCFHHLAFLADPALPRPVPGVGVWIGGAHPQDGSK